MNATVEVSATGPEVQLRNCWSQIGVHGDSTCPELKNFIHCRNCPVYSNAGAQLLDRPLPPNYRRDWTDHFARKKRTAAPAKISAVLFRIESEWLALPTQAFQEVAERRMIHSLPHRRAGLVLGLVNVRGELLICVSFSRLLGIKKVGAEESQAAGHGSVLSSTPGVTRSSAAERQRGLFARLLVAKWEANRFAIPVDEVHGIHRFEAQDLKEPPATIARSGVCYTRGILSWHNRSVGFLNASVVFPKLDRNLA
jgi:chemotaxis-related protein WspD